MGSELWSSYSKLIKTQTAVLLLATMGVLAYFWSQGHIDGERQKKIANDSYSIQEAKKELVQNNWNKLLNDSKESLVLKEINLISRKVEGISWFKDNKNYEKYQRRKSEVNKQLNSLVSQPNMKEVIRVFSRKIGLFESYVISNNWRTLSRVSGRVNGLMEGVSLNSGRIFNILKSINRDLNTMRKVTLGSVLSDDDKKNITARLEDLNTELSMLSAYVSLKKNVLKSLTEYKQSVSEILNDIGPEISVAKIESENIGKDFALSLLILCSLVIFQFFVVYFFLKRANTKLNKKVENKIEKIVEEGVLKGDDAQYNDLSNKCFSKLSSVSRYIEKRMNFSSIFQETLPFESFLLNDNLSVIWANKNLYESLGLTDSDITKDLLTWDFLKKSTNLDDMDPIIDCLKSNVSGIYQVQVQGPNGKRHPYEMYVRSIDVEGQRYVMVYLNCLVSMQETIDAQVRSTLGPIKKTLRALIKGDFGSKYYQENLEQFQRAGIEEVLKDFMGLNEIIEFEKDDNVKSLERLSERFDKLEQLLQNIYEANDDVSLSSYSVLKEFSKLKENIIHMASLNSDLSSSFANSLKVINMSKFNIKSLSSNASLLSSAIREGGSSIPNIELMKQEIKEYKDELRSSKSKIYQRSKELMSFKKQIQDESKKMAYEHHLEKLNNDMKGFDQHFSSLDKKIQSFEVLISKAKLVFNGLNQSLDSLEKVDGKEIYSSINENEKSLSSSLNNVVSELRTVEESMIENLQSIFSHSKSCNERSVEIKKMQAHSFYMEEDSAKSISV